MSLELPAGVEIEIKLNNGFRLAPHVLATAAAKPCGKTHHRKLL